MLKKIRPGEQQLPVQGKQDVSHAAQTFIRSMVPFAADYATAELICTDLESRVADYGVAAYGYRLASHNGRDMLRDADEEILDAVNFMQGDLIEHPLDGDSLAIYWAIIDVAFRIKHLQAKRKADAAAAHPD